MNCGKTVMKSMMLLGDLTNVNKFSHDDVGKLASVTCTTARATKSTKKTIVANHSGPSHICWYCLRSSSDRTSGLTTGNVSTTEMTEDITTTTEMKTKYILLTTE